MTVDHLMAAAIGFVVCELLHMTSSRNRHALARLRRVVRRKQQPARLASGGNFNPPPTHDKPPAPPAPQAAPERNDRAGWHPLPGQRLEYKASGFYIVPAGAGAQAMHAYQLYNPEGVICATGPFLDGLQAMGERMAADRAAFNPRKAAA